jgi:hypothetical protein
MPRVITCSNRECRAQFPASTPNQRYGYCPPCRREKQSAKKQSAKKRASSARERGELTEAENDLLARIERMTCRVARP